MASIHGVKMSNFQFFLSRSVFQFDQLSSVDQTTFSRRTVTSLRPEAASKEFELTGKLQRVITELISEANQSQDKRERERIKKQVVDFKVVNSRS